MMWTLRKAQMDVLREDALMRFCERLGVLLREAYPLHVAAFAPDELSSFVREGVLRAHRWGFQSDAALGDYVSLRLQLGPGFDEHAAVRAVLEDPGIPMEERIGTLFRRLSPDQWRAVREQG